MMILPPIDQLEKIAGNKYRLCVLTSKRAKELEQRIPAQLQTSEKKSISLAADEILEGKVVANE
ncbi:MAG: DNA-directed RNA polymerase subunit omega [Clostridia bacterium]